MTITFTSEPGLLVFKGALGLMPTHVEWKLFRLLRSCSRHTDHATWGKALPT